MTIEEIKDIVARDAGNSQQLEALSRCGLPTRREEHYLYTDVAKALSFGKVMKGEAMVSGEVECEDLKATEAATDAKALELLNSATATQCKHLTLKGTSAEPVDLFVYNDDEENALMSCQALISVEPQAERQLIIRHCAQSQGTILSDIKIHVGEGAQLDVVMISDAPEASVLTQTRIDQAANSRVQISTIDINAKQVRNDLVINLNGEGATTEANGLYMVDTDCHTDNNTLIAHNAPHCDSSELYKGVIGSDAVGAFCGKILVKPNSQKTQAYQTNRNMLLTRQSRAYSQPQLEIYADDVKCSHGSTSGQIDEKQLFYMQQRGIDEATAQQLLTAAFALEVVDKIRINDVRTALRQRLTNEEEL